jgi:hypothetical protein
MASSGFIVQCDGIVLWGTASPAATDISDQVVSAKLTINNGVGSFTTLGTKWAKRTEGTRDATFEFTFVPEIGASKGATLLNAWLFPASGKPGKRFFKVTTPDALTGSFVYEFSGYTQGSTPMDHVGNGAEIVGMPVTVLVDGAVVQSLVI